MLKRIKLVDRMKRLEKKDEFEDKRPGKNNLLRQMTVYPTRNLGKFT